MKGKREEKRGEKWIIGNIREEKRKKWNKQGRMRFRRE